MTDNPTIKVSGAGSRREAADIGQAVGKGVASAVAARPEPLHIDTLRIRLPANSAPAALEQAIRAALDKERRR